MSAFSSLRPGIVITAAAALTLGIFITATPSRGSSSAWLNNVQAGQNGLGDGISQFLGDSARRVRAAIAGNTAVSETDGTSTSAAQLGLLAGIDLPAAEKLAAKIASGPVSGMAARASELGLNMAFSPVQGWTGAGASGASSFGSGGSGGGSGLGSRGVGGSGARNDDKSSTTEILASASVATAEAVVEKVAAAILNQVTAPVAETLGLTTGKDEQGVSSDEAQSAVAAISKGTPLGNAAVATVPESGATLGLLALAVGAAVVARRRLAS